MDETNPKAKNRKCLHIQISTHPYTAYRNGWELQIGDITGSVGMTTPDDPSKEEVLGEIARAMDELKSEEGNAGQEKDKMKIIKIRKYDDGVLYEEGVKLCEESNCEMIDTETYLSIPLENREYDDYLTCHIKKEKDGSVLRGVFSNFGYVRRGLVVGGRSGDRRGVLGMKRAKESGNEPVKSEEVINAGDSLIVSGEQEQVLALYKAARTSNSEPATEEEDTLMKKISDSWDLAEGSKALALLRAHVRAEVEKAMGVRPEILAFVLAMEEKMKANDSKKGGSWKQMSEPQLYNMLAHELKEYLDFNDPNELVDVANFSMMIWFNEVEQDAHYPNLRERAEKEK